MKKNIFSGIIIDNIGLLVIIITGMVAIPFYLEYISISNYGVWLSIGGISAVLSLMELGTDQYLTNITVDDKVFNSKSYQKTLHTLFIIKIFSILIIIFGSTILYIYIDKFINIDIQMSKEIKNVYIICVINIILGAFNSTLTTILFARNYYKIVNISNIISSIMIVLISYAMLIYELRLISFPFSILICNIISILVLTLILFNIYGAEKFALNWDGQLYKLKEILSYSFNFQGIRILSTFRNFIPLILIGKLIDPVEVAKYSISTRLIQLGPTIFNKFSIMFFPKISKSISDQKLNDTKRVFVILTKVMIRGAVFLGLILFYGTKYFVILWVGLDKYIGDHILALIIIYMGINISMGLFGITVFSNKKFEKWTLYGYFEISLAIFLAIYLFSLIGTFGILLGLYLASIPSQIYLYRLVCTYYQIDKKIFILDLVTHAIKSNVVLIGLIILLFYFNIYPATWIELIFITFGLIVSNLIVVAVKFYRNSQKEFVDRLLDSLR